MNRLFLCLVHWLAPVISFTSEEAWKEYCSLGILGDACGDVAAANGSEYGGVKLCERCRGVV